MTYPALSDEQAARADALGVAHRLLAGRGEAKGLLSAPSTSGLLTDELLPAVRLAEYVLTGKYVATAADLARVGLDRVALEGVTEEEPDERIRAWHRVADHPFFRGCYAEERPLIDAMLDLLTLAATSAETVHNHGPAQGQGRDCSERTDGHGHIRGMCMASAPTDEGTAP